MFLTFVFFFFNDTATTEIYTLSLHDALPISIRELLQSAFAMANCGDVEMMKFLLTALFSKDWVRFIEGDSAKAEGPPEIEVEEIRRITMHFATEKLPPSVPELDPIDIEADECKKVG